MHSVDDGAVLHYELIIAEGADPKRPGIYEWVIEGAGRYIGKYTHRTRPEREYQKNVRNYLAGNSYRKGKPEKFRRIHVELAKAVRDARTVTLIFLENPPVECLFMRERDLIQERGNLNGW